MSGHDFMRREQGRVRDSLDALVLELKKIEPTITWPLRKVVPPRNDNSTELPEIFISDGRQVKKLFRGGEWSSENIVLPREDYTSLSGITMGETNPIRYLLVGYRTKQSPSGKVAGIYLQNLGEPEFRHIVVDMNSSQRDSGFQSPQFIRTGESDYDFTLVAAHSEFGVIKVPLDEFVGTTELRIGLNDKDHVLFRKPQDNPSHLRLCAGERGIYFANGKKIYLSEDLIHFEKVFELPADVNAIVSREQVYCGTTDGRIFRDAELFFNLRDINFSIERIFEGAHQGRKGIFFNTYGNNHHERIYFTDGSVKEMVTPSIVGAADFRMSGDSAYYITRGAAVAYHHSKKSKEEIMHRTDDKKSLKHLCVLEELK